MVQIRNVPDPLHRKLKAVRWSPARRSPITCWPSWNGLPRGPRVKRCWRGCTDEGACP
jgi:hypothetical protein